MLSADIGASLFGGHGLWQVGAPSLLDLTAVIERRWSAEIVFKETRRFVTVKARAETLSAFTPAGLLTALGRSPERPSLVGIMNKSLPLSSKP